MKRWEYHVELLETPSSWPIETTAQYAERYKALQENWENYLNEMGNAGWELVTIYGDKMALFKREAP